MLSILMIMLQLASRWTSLFIIDGPHTNYIQTNIFKLSSHIYLKQVLDWIGFTSLRS